MGSLPTARVRTAQPTDDGPLQRIDVATWTAQIGPGAPPQADASFFQTIAIDDVLVADIDGEVVGYIKFGPFYKMSSSAHVLEIKGMAVAPNHQRRGTGKLLIHAAVQLATNRGARKLMLRVLSSNQPARTLYESCGFNTEAILREQFLLDGDYVDDVFMAIHLAA